MFYGHFCAHGRLNDETPFRYDHAEIRTGVVVICDPKRYCKITEDVKNVFPVWSLFLGGCSKFLPDYSQGSNME